ncbi:MAG: RNA 2',3'-cyclic phosphodiesterase [Halothiobacillaceae bacterium]
MPASEHGQAGAVGRYFFALWPRAEVRDALARAAEALPRCGRAVPPTNYHLTLAFLGNLDRQCLPALEEAGAAVHGQADSLPLTRFDGFARARVLFAAPKDCPDWLADWQAALLDSLSAVGYAPEKAFGRFRPHVTLRRRVDLPLPELPEVMDPAVDWAGSELALLESPLTSGMSGYRVIWPTASAGLSGRDAARSQRPLSGGNR